MLQWLKHRLFRVIVTLIVIMLVAGLATSFPPDFALLMAVDLSTWVEAALAVYVATQITRVRPILIFIRARILGPLRRSARHARTRPLKKLLKPSNDDEPPAELAFAA
jgi:hypothetical protein